jgi:uncharacterized protein (DUF1697 family)
VFESEASPSRVKAEREGRLRAHAGKRVDFVMRSAPEMLAVLKDNPLPEAELRYTYAIFLYEPPPSDALTHVSGQHDEEMRFGEREIFIHYLSGMGRSKLRIPAAKTGTARNMNTVAKRVQITSKP